MDRVTQSNAANAEELAAASEELSVQGEKMKNIISAFINLVEGMSEQENKMNEKQSFLKIPSESKKHTFPSYQESCNRQKAGIHKQNVYDIEPEQMIPINEDFKEF